MNVDEFKKKVVQDIKEIVGENKHTETLAEKWKTEMIKRVGTRLDEMLPKDKIFKTTTDVTILYGKYGFDKTSTMLVTVRDDYFITAMYTNPKRICVLVVIMAVCIADI